MVANASPVSGDPSSVITSGDPWSDLVLTLPMFIGYHLGVIFLPIRNAADLVTRELVALADHDMPTYGCVTLGIGFTYVLILGLAGRGHALRWQRFALMLTEGILYAVAMRLAANYVVGRMLLAPAEVPQIGLLGSLVLSFGAGFYEEVAFRVILFGFGLKVMGWLHPFPDQVEKLFVATVWAVVTSAAFSAWHYVGALGEPFDPQSFLFRWVCGFVFVVIYAFRGFAPVVWTHAIYDVWVMVF